MAVVDLQTGKIYGCKKNSYSWWHEKGHIEFDKNYYGADFNYKKELFLKVCIILLIANAVYESFIFKVWLVALGGLSLYLYFYEEVWCWVYAWKKK